MEWVVEQQRILSGNDLVSFFDKRSWPSLEFVILSVVVHGVGVSAFFTTRI